MAFEKKQYDVVLIEPPNKYLVERWDQPNYPAIGVAYIGNYLKKNTKCWHLLINSVIKDLAKYGKTVILSKSYFWDF